MEGSQQRLRWYRPGKAVWESMRFDRTAVLRVVVPSAPAVFIVYWIGRRAGVQLNIWGLLAAPPVIYLMVFGEYWLISKFRRYEVNERGIDSRRPRYDWNRFIGFHVESHERCKNLSVLTLFLDKGIQLRRDLPEDRELAERIIEFVAARVPRLSDTPTRPGRLVIPDDVLHLLLIVTGFWTALLGTVFGQNIFKMSVELRHQIIPNLLLAGMIIGPGTFSLFFGRVRKLPSNQKLFIIASFNMLGSVLTMLILLFIISGKLL